MTKEKLKEKMEAARFAPITDELFRLYEEFEEQCGQDQESGQEDILWLSFYRGETYFRIGKYKEALQKLNTCFLKSDGDTDQVLMINCNNLAGLIYYAMGREFQALQYYRNAIEIAEKVGDHRRKVIVQINVAWMYRDLENYEKSLDYLQRAAEELKCVTDQGDYSLGILIKSYQGQVYVKLGCIQEACVTLEAVEKLWEQEEQENFYEAALLNFVIRVYTMQGEEKKRRWSIDRLLKKAEEDQDFLEFGESYFDICEYLTETEPEQGERLVEILRRHCRKLELPFISMKLVLIELKAAKYCGNRERWQKLCENFMEFYMQCQIYERQWKAASLDIVEKLETAERENRKNLQKSRQDQMTGLLNKTAFEKRVRSLLKHRDYSAGGCALAVIDIDEFKQINDTYGHLSGDGILCGLAEQMKKIMDETAVLGRIGGDEFAVFWERAKPVEAVYEQTERLHEAVRDAHDHISVSIGLKYAEAQVSYEVLFGEADALLYRAKAAGKGRTEKE